ncbi:MAG TPA: response regulator [Burkholderiaceae bacterium]|nr:response regulator [Burkholderiaceae bacterium]
MRVVIVDDSPDVQIALSGLLDAEPGVEVAGCAPDQDGALALIEACAPDLVVLDVDLANNERGYDVLRQIRQRHADLAVIMLTNYGWTAMRSAFIDAGALAYFDKALQFREAIDWIRGFARSRERPAR